MDFDDVYYIDPSRNAPTPTVIDRTRVPVRPTTVIHPSPRYPAAPYQYQAQPAYYGPNFAGYPGYPVNPSYVLPQQPSTPQPSSNLASILGGFGDVGVLANLVAQVVGAFLPLPDAPKPQDSVDSENQSLNAAVNSSNMIRYQSALAQFARRDQQILTLGSVLEKLFRRPSVTG